LVGDLAGVELPPPLDGLAQGHDRRGRSGFLGRLWVPGLAAALGDGADHLIVGHSARQVTDVAVLEGPVRPQGDLDGLFAVFDKAIGVVGRYVYYPKPDFRNGPSELIEGSSGSQKDNRETTRPSG